MEQCFFIATALFFIVTWNFTYLPNVALLHMNQGFVKSSNMPREKRAKFALVRYKEDGIHFVCKREHLKIVGGKCQAKYFNGVYYPANILVCNDEKSILLSLKTNIESGFPKVSVINAYGISSLRKNETNSFIPIHEESEKNTVIEDHEFSESEKKTVTADHKFRESEKNTLTEDHELRTLGLVVCVNADSDKNVNVQPECPFNSGMDNECFPCSSKDVFNHAVPVDSVDLLPIDTDDDYITDDNLMEQIDRFLEVNNVVSDVRTPKKTIMKTRKIKSPLTESVDEVPDTSSGEKKNFCSFCGKLITKFARHVTTQHQDVPEIRKILEFPKGSKERAKLITAVRQESNYLFNSNKKNSGLIIVSRRPQIGKNRTFEHYVPCGNCKAMFSRVSYRKHFKKCTGLKCRSKDALLTSRRIDCDIHVKASDVLKNEVFPVMRNDAVVEAIRHDELVIIFANKLLSKYRLKHQYNMIRSKLRAIGRFILEFKKIHPEISNLADVYHPRYFDSVVETIDIIAGLKRSSGTYRAPGTAFGLGSILKSICDHLISECIKNRDHVKKTLVKDFKKLMGEGLAYGINKSVQEQQVERRFRKQIQLPSLHDLKCLNKYLSSKRREEYLRLKEKFTFDRWKNLLSFLLTSAQIFNRRRSGEIERVQLADFELYQTIDPENEQILQTLGVDIRTHASRFVRFSVRGKLGRPVRVILSRELLIMLQLTVTYRYKASVHKDNPYLFGLPGRDSKRYNHLSACDLMRKFAAECGAKNPTSLRGTELRKHFATQCVQLELDPALVKEVANFMGHADKIHEQYYRIPILAQDVTVMADLLQKVQGSSDDEDTIHNWENRESVKSREVNNNSVGDSFTFNSTESGSSIITPDVSKSYVEEEKAKTKRSCPTEYSEEDSSDLESVEMKPAIVRRSWSTPERTIVKEAFKDHIRTMQLPSLQDCQELIASNAVLRKRTPEQTKAWVNNQIRKTEPK